MKKIAKGARKFRGFTLVELIVVITILAVLATIGFLALSGYSQDAKDSSVKANVRSVQTAIATESAITNNSPRYYVVHDPDYALSGAMVYVEGTGLILTGGNVGQAPLDSNYTAGKPDYAKLKLNPDKFKISGRFTIPVLESVFAAYDPQSAFVGAVDVSRIGESGKKRGVSYFQVGAVSPSTKTASVNGNFPASGAPAGYSAGLIKANPGTSSASTGALVDGSNSNAPTTVVSNGACGTANAQNSYDYPSASLCSAGTASGTDLVGTDGAYDWSCIGAGGGSAVSCSAPHVYYGSCFALLS